MSADSRLFGDETPQPIRMPRRGDAAVVTEGGWAIVAAMRGRPLPRAHRLTLVAGDNRIVPRLTHPGVVSTLCGQHGRLVTELETGVEARLCVRCQREHKCQPSGAER